MFLVVVLSLGFFISVIAGSQLAGVKSRCWSPFLPAFLLSGFLYSIEQMPGSSVVPVGCGTRVNIRKHRRRSVHSNARQTLGVGLAHRLHLGESGLTFHLQIFDLGWN